MAKIRDMSPRVLKNEIERVKKDADDAIGKINVAIDGELMSDVNAEIGEHTDNRFVSAAEVAEAVMNLQDGTDSYVQSYSASPKRVGTWIDGAPVWRMAFEFSFKDYFSEYPVDYEAMLSDERFALELPLKNGGQDNLRVLNIQAVQASNVEDPSQVDDIPISRRFYDGGLLGIPIITAVLPSTYAELLNDGIYGWVEFATPESNIKTS